MKLRGPVLAATDLSGAADAALAQGHALASRLGAPFIVCHVLPEAFRVRVLFPQNAGVDTPVQAELQRTATAVIRARIEAVVGGTPDVAVEIESGSAHAGILAVAERVGAGVIVVGPGATAQRVARHAMVPVLIARPSRPKGIVIGATDFSDPSLPAVHLAADEAARRGADLRLVHCLDIDDTAHLATMGLPGTFPVPPLSPSAIEGLEAAARDRLHEALAGTGATGECVVLLRAPAAGIVESAQTPPAALIVVGTRGRTGLSRLALGSVAEAVVSHAPCSVLVVPLSPAG